MKELKDIEALLKSNDEDLAQIAIDSLVEMKEKMVEVMLDGLITTTDHSVRHSLVLAIVDNFKDDRIIPTLKKMINDKNLKTRTGILVYALGEYSNSVDLLEFLVDLVLEADYLPAWNALGILF